MSQNSAQQRKIRVLKQIAQDRVQLLTSLDDMRSHAGACSETLYLHKPIVRKGLLLFASSAFAFLAFKKYQRKKKGEFALLASKFGVVRFLAAKMAADVFIPWLRKHLGVADSEKKRKRGIIQRLISRAE